VSCDNEIYVQDGGFGQIRHEQVRKEELSKVMILVFEDILW
jgi:hypothetical protein